MLILRLSDHVKLSFTFVSCYQPETSKWEFSTCVESRISGVGWGRRTCCLTTSAGWLSKYCKILVFLCTGEEIGCCQWKGRKHHPGDGLFRQDVEVTPRGIVLGPFGKKHSKTKPQLIYTLGLGLTGWNKEEEIVLWGVWQYSWFQIVNFAVDYLGKWLSVSTIQKLISTGQSRPIAFRLSRGTSVPPSRLNQQTLRKISSTRSR